MLIQESLLMPYFEEADGGSGGQGDQGTGGGDGDPGKKAGADDSAKKTAAGGDPNATRTGGTKDPGAPAWEAEKRAILADLKKERTARQTHEAAVATTRAELEQERRRVQALAGVNPRSAEDVDNDAIRARLQQLVPALGKLSDDKIDRLLALADQADSIAEAGTAQWVRHGTDMLDSLTEAVSKELGGKLSDRQAQRVKAAYVQAAEASTDEQGKPVPGGFLARHERGDKTLIAEFVKEWIDDWFEPAKRSVTANEVARQRRVPSARDRSIAGQGEKKVDLSNDKAFGDALVASFAKHGGAFGE